ncbi:MAG: NmrA family NAD(P)-binding protein [Nitrososphaerales archaeon]
MILVTGAAGKTGRAVISALVRKKQLVRALVYREEQVHQVESLGATDVLVGDMRSKDTLERAVDGSESVYHICPNVNPDEFQLGNSIVASAVSANVGHFVFHSVLHPQVESMPHHWMKMRVEEVLLGSGLNFSILQPAPYMQNLQGQLSDILERGIYPVPYSANAPISLVDLEDVAEAAANVLTNPTNVGATYELAGPEILTPNQMAEILSRHLNRVVHATRISLEMWRQQAQTAGLGGYQLEILEKMFAYYDRNGLWGNPLILKTLLGRQPTSFSEYVKRTIQSELSRTKPAGVTHLPT